MRGLFCTIPPLLEQQAIAAILGSLDDKIELNRKMNQTLEAMARALFKSWFIDFDPVRTNQQQAAGQTTQADDARARFAHLFPASFQDSSLGPIPEGWVSSTIGDEFSLTMGQSPPGHTYNEEGEGLPFFQGCRDFGFRYPTNRVFCTQPGRLAEGGDAIVSVRAPVGAINMAAEQSCIGRGVAAARHRTRSRSYTYYAMHTLGEDFARYDAEGTVFGSINKKGFQSIKWLAPPEKVVRAFEEIVYSIDQQIRANEFQRNTLDAIRDTLLPKLLSGEIRVREAERIAAQAESEPEAAVERINEQPKHATTGHVPKSKN